MFFGFSSICLYLILKIKGEKVNLLSSLNMLNDTLHSLVYFSIDVNSSVHGELLSERQ